MTAIDAWRGTPGPWRIVCYGDGDSLVIHDARGDWRVCFMATPGFSLQMDRIEANARLITAAPDLIEAAPDAADILERYADFIRTLHSDELERHPYLPLIEETAERLRAAIAKALPAPPSTGGR